jgi:hypothetical protein
MDEQDKLTIIDEKPKRGQRKQKPKLLMPNRVWVALIGMIAVLLIALLLIYFTITPQNDFGGDDWRVTALTETEERRMEFARLTQTPIQQTATALGLNYDQYYATLIIEGATQTANAFIQASETRRAAQSTPTPSVTVTSAP